MDTPLVSVIIPTLNAAETLRRTLQSIDNQSLKALEVILVDGGSDDDTVEIAESFESLNITTIVDEGSGVYAAMNIGIDESKGWWLYFLGADDVLADSNTLQQMTATAGDAQIVFGDVRYVNRVSKKIPEIHEAEFSSKLKWKNSLHHQGTIYRRDLFDDFRYNTEYRILADYELNLLCWLTGVTAFGLDRIIADVDASGLSKNFNRALYAEELEMKKKYFGPLMMIAQWFWVKVKFVWKNS